MHSKSLPSTSHPHSDQQHLATNAYVNHMFALILIGILSFLGIVSIFGQGSATSLPAESSLSLSTQTQP